MAPDEFITYTIAALGPASWFVDSTKGTSGYSFRTLQEAERFANSLAQRNMRISVDKETEKIKVALYDGDGKLIREVPASHATAMLSGERPVGWLSK